MKIHQLSIDEAFGALRSGPEGLSAAEALRRLEEYGPNRVERAAQEPAIWRLLKEFTQFFSVILWVVAGLAFVAEWSDPGQGMARHGADISAHAARHKAVWGKYCSLPAEIMSRLFCFATSVPAMPMAMKVTNGLPTDSARRRARRRQGLHRHDRGNRGVFGDEGRARVIDAPQESVAGAGYRGEEKS